MINEITPEALDTIEKTWQSNRRPGGTIARNVILELVSELRRLYKENEQLVHDSKNLDDAYAKATDKIDTVWTLLANEEEGWNVDLDDIREALGGEVK